jgi:hypothetical protein
MLIVGGHRVLIDVCKSSLVGYTRNEHNRLCRHTRLSGHLAHELKLYAALANEPSWALSSSEYQELVTLSQIICPVANMGKGESLKWSLVD